MVISLEVLSATSTSVLVSKNSSSSFAQLNNNIAAKRGKAVVILLNMRLLISSYKSNVFQRQHILVPHRLCAGLLREGAGRYVLPHMLLTGIMVSYFPFVIGVGYVYRCRDSFHRLYHSADEGSLACFTPFCFLLSGRMSSSR